MSSPIIDSSKWTPSASWSENLTNNTQHLRKNRFEETIWKPYFNPFANKLPSYELDFNDNQTFDYINGFDPWGRPLVSSIWYVNGTVVKTALWQVQVGGKLETYLETVYNKSRIYKNFRLIGFTTVNKEVVRLYIRNISSDSLDKLKYAPNKRAFLEWKPANKIDQTIEDTRPVPKWII